MGRLIFLLSIAAVLVGCTSDAPPPREPAVLDVGPAPQPLPARDPLLTQTPGEGLIPVEFEEPAAGQPRTYVVRRGDTFWNIAERELGDGQRWRDIAAANPRVQPGSMNVGQEITLPAL
jgi:nucleoid-associated protein YgaU